MILSNFVLTHTKQDRSGETSDQQASVDVTTGSLWWKKTVRRVIHKKYAGFWFFADNGEFTPEHQAENLERAWKARAMFKDQKEKS